MACLIAAGLVFGCASSQVQTRQQHVGDERLPRPGRVIVYDIAATPNDIRSDSALIGQYQRRSTPQTSKQIEVGRQLGAMVSQRLVQEIQAMGMPTALASAGFAPRAGDLLIRGAFVNIDEGSRAARMLIGFGAGAGELKTFVEGFQITPEGPRRLGEAVIKSSGGKTPGMLVPVLGGAAKGGAAASAAISGGMNVAQELGPGEYEIGGESHRQGNRQIAEGWVYPAGLDCTLIRRTR
jgi:hypothetical protein